MESQRQRSNMNTGLTTYCIYGKETSYTLLHIERGEEKSKKKKRKKENRGRNKSCTHSPRYSQRIISYLKMV